MFAKRIQTLTPSPTLALNAKAQALKKAGQPILNLTAGEPDFPTPAHVKEHAIKAIREDFSHYTAPDGILALREVVQKTFKKENGLDYALSEIIIGAGSKQLLYCALQVLCEKGDEVIVATPTWSTYIEQIQLAGAKPVLVALQPPFRLTAHDIKNVITPKTKVLLLNSPANPTGMMIEKEELEKIAKLALKHNCFVISDEIYERLQYGKKHVSIATLGAKIKAQTITISGVSKAYAMTGWRIGYAGGPKELIAAMSALQSQIISNPPSISQKAAIAALASPRSVVESMRKSFARRRKNGLKKLHEIAQLRVVEPDGAFYFFVSVEGLLGKTYKTATAWCKALLEKEHVALVPGEAFAYPGYVRLSYAVSEEELLRAIVKIKKFIEETQ